MKIQVNQEKLFLTQSYLNIPTPTIELKNLGNNKSEKIDLHALEVKVVKVPQLDDKGDRIDGVFTKKISTVLYCNKDDIILSLAGSIARWAVGLIKSLGIDIEDTGYFHVTGLDMKIVITHKVINNRNIYRVTTKDIKSNEVDLVSLNLVDIRQLLNMDMLLLDEPTQQLFLQEGAVND
jgi:hypothetical protein